VGRPKRKKVPEETCTPYVGCTRVAECRPRSGESHLAKMSEIPEITKEPPGKPESSNECSGRSKAGSREVAPIV